MKSAAPVLHSLALSLLIVSSALTSPAAAQDRLTTLVGNGSVMLHTPNGGELLSINPDNSLIPASLLKIPLAQVSLNTLSEDYRFETHFYRNSDGDLLIRGLGDPFLVSEEIGRIADAVSYTHLTLPTTPYV